MTHPHLLHLRASSWSLTRALEELEARARDWTDDTIGDVSIPSQVFGRRTALGGHGDPTAATVLAAWAPGVANRHAALLGDIMRELDKDAQHLPGAPGMDPLTRIRQAVTRPHVAERVVVALTHLDGKVREHLGVRPALMPLDELGAARACPGCRMVALYVQTAAPSHLWTVICRAECVCSGDGCPCGMPVRVEGVAHIWDRNAPFLTGHQQAPDLSL